MLGLSKREIYEKAAPATLLIVLMGDNGPESVGSGVVISESGLAVTNHHVIEDRLNDQSSILCFLYPSAAPHTSDDLIDFLKRHKHEAIRCKIGLQAPEIDIAFLQLETRPKPYPFIPLGDSTSVRPGDDVVCIGNPHGLVWTITAGSVSANRENAIQISAPISPGNSGGPLLNMTGELVGVNSFTHMTGQNLNFARPARLIRKLLSEPAGGVSSTWRSVPLARTPRGISAASCHSLSVGDMTRHILSIELASSTTGGSSLIEGATTAVVLDASFRTYASWWRNGTVTKALGTLVAKLVERGAEGVHVYLAGVLKKPYEYVGFLKHRNDAHALQARFIDAASARAVMGMDRQVLPAVIEIDRALGKPGANLLIGVIGAGAFADDGELKSWFQRTASKRNSSAEPYALGLRVLSIETAHADNNVANTPAEESSNALVGAVGTRTVRDADAAFENIVEAFRRSFLCVGVNGAFTVSANSGRIIFARDAHTNRGQAGGQFRGFEVVPECLQLGIEGSSGQGLTVSIAFEDLNGKRQSLELSW